MGIAYNMLTIKGENDMIHEPDLKELKRIQKELFAAESTDMNLKKLKALEVQIARHEGVK